jgi:multicomponent Na+:H+ antiporter subunit G
VIVLLVLLVAVALFFHAVAAVGILRMPDFYTRLHAVAKAETVGVVLTATALIVWVGPSLLALKIGFVAAFLFLANPTSTHAIGRAALRTGLQPWQREPLAGPARESRNE